MIPEQANNIFDLIRKLLNFRNANHSSDIQEVRGGKSNETEITDKRFSKKRVYLASLSSFLEIPENNCSTDSAVEISENLRANAQKNRAKRNRGRGQKLNQSYLFNDEVSFQRFWCLFLKIRPGFESSEKIRFSHSHWRKITEYLA